MAEQLVAPEVQSQILVVPEVQRQKQTVKVEGFVEPVVVLELEQQRERPVDSVVPVAVAEAKDSVEQLGQQLVRRLDGAILERRPFLPMDDCHVLEEVRAQCNGRQPAFLAS